MMISQDQMLVNGYFISRLFISSCIHLRSICIFILYEKKEHCVV